MTGLVRFKDLPSTEALERAAEEVQDRRKATAASLLEAAHGLQAAQQEVEARQVQYAAAWKAATSGAWDSSELTRQGFPKPATTRSTGRRRKRDLTHTTNSATTHETEES